MPRSGRRKRHAEIVDRLAGEINKDNNVLGGISTGPAPVDHQIEVLVEATRRRGKVGIAQGRKGFAQKDKVTMGAEDAVLAEGGAPVQRGTVAERARGVEFLPHPEHRRPGSGQREDRIEQRFPASRLAPRIAGIHAVGQTLAAVEVPRFVVVVGEDDTVTRGLRPPVDLGKDPADVGRCGCDLRRDLVVKAGLPMAVETVSRVINPQLVGERALGIPVTIGPDGEQIRILGYTPATGILCVNHPVDLHDQTFPLRRHRVGIGAALSCVITQDILRRIPPETVNTKVVKERLDIFLDEAPYFELGVVGTVAPRGPAADGIGRKINVGRAVELPKPVARRVPVIVHHIELHLHSALVGGFDQPFQAIRAAVNRLDGEEMFRVVAPAVIAPEFVDRHERDNIDTQPLQIIESGDGIVESGRAVVAGIGVVKASDMQLIHHLPVHRDAGAGACAPIKDTVVVDDGIAITDPHRPGIMLPRAGGVAGPADEVFVFLIRPGIGHRDRPIVRGAIPRHGGVVPTAELAPHGHAGRIGCPNPEGHAGDIAATAVNGGAEGQRLGPHAVSGQAETDQKKADTAHIERRTYNLVVQRSNVTKTIQNAAHQKLCGTSIWSPGRRIISRVGLLRTALMSTICTLPPRMRRTLRWSA